MDFNAYWDNRIEANKRLFDNNPGIANFAFDECQLLYEHMIKQLVASKQRVKELEEELRKIRAADAFADEIFSIRQMSE